MGEGLDSRHILEEEQASFAELNVREKKRVKDETDLRHAPGQMEWQFTETRRVTG